MSSILITGAAGEIGQSLIAAYSTQKESSITCLDLQDRPVNIPTTRLQWCKGSVTDQALISSLLHDQHFDHIFHLAALLSAAAASKPEIAHQVNIEGSRYLLDAVRQSSQRHAKPTRVLFPSSIAVYGMTKENRETPVKESFQSVPTTLYGKQKAEIEEYGTRTFAGSQFCDFRSIRFPGLISAETLPVGGTSDYASLMAHNAAQGKPYSCFVSAHTTLTFLAMPDAVSALLQLASTSSEKLSRNVYNLHGFTISAQEIADFTLSVFPNWEVSFKSVAEKQKIVDSWPAEVDCSAFKRDVAWEPTLDKRATFFEYLFPKIRTFYASPKIAI